jgi:hypothetical protein
MTEHTIKPLNLDTWDAYARLIEKHNGIWGGCWCTWFHADDPAFPKKDNTGIDRDHRRTGVSGEALHGALELIAASGGGTVEGYPHDLPQGKKMSSSFLYNATRSMFQSQGFDYIRPLGTAKCVMRRTVAAA